MVDSLLRAGADETLVSDYGNKAADVIGEDVEEEKRLAEDIDSVRRSGRQGMASPRLPGVVPCLPGQGSAAQPRD